METNRDLLHWFDKGIPDVCRVRTQIRHGSQTGNNFIVAIVLVAEIEHTHARADIAPDDELVLFWQIPIAAQKLINSTPNVASDN